MKKVLKKIEEEKNIEILFASLGGSRAYGVFNKESDYDVKFIYKQKELINYFEPKKRNTIKKKINNIDIEGIDITKAITLLKKKNYTIIEWINAPTIYIKNENLKNSINKIYKTYCSGYTMLLHNNALAMNLIHDKKEKRLKNAIHSYLICENIIKIGCSKLDNFSNDELMKEISDGELKTLISEYSRCIREEEDFNQNKLLKKLLKERLKEIKNIEVSKTPKVPQKLYSNIIKEILKI